MARHMRPSCKGPALWAPGAIPTVDFLLYRFGAIVKKMGVKTHDWIARRIQHDLRRAAQASLVVEREALHHRVAAEFGAQPVDRLLGRLAALAPRVDEVGRGGVGRRAGGPGPAADPPGG